MSKRQRASASGPPPALPLDASAEAAPARSRKQPRKQEGSGDPTGVFFSLQDKAATITFSRDRRTATCAKGYRMVRTTTGVSSGAWYFEFTVSPDTKPTSHFRLGVSTELGESHGPVGYTHHSYGYRDVGGSRVHQSIRSAYGRPYGAGDVIGCLVDFSTPQHELAAAEARDGGASAGPADGARQARAAAAAAAGADKDAIEALLHCAEPPQAVDGGSAEGRAGAGASAGAGAGAGAGGAGEGAGSSSGADLGAMPAVAKHTVSRRWWGSSVRFFVNGEDQGIAFVHLTREARLLPAASLFSGGSVRLNPGPVFAHPPCAARFPAAAAAPSSSGAGAEGEGSGAALGAGAAAAPTLPCCSPWRPFSETEEALPQGAPGLSLSALAAPPGAASSALLGSGLLRGTSYNFANTEFAFEGSAAKGSKDGGGRSKKRR